MWLFLKILGRLIAKISGSTERQTTHDSKSKQVLKKLKENKKKVTETKKLRTIHMLSITIFRKEQSLTKN